MRLQLPDLEYKSSIRPFSRGAFKALGWWRRVKDLDAPRYWELVLDVSDGNSFNFESARSTILQPTANCQGSVLWICCLQLKVQSLAERIIAPKAEARLAAEAAEFARILEEARKTPLEVRIVVLSMSCSGVPSVILTGQTVQPFHCVRFKRFPYNHTHGSFSLN